MAQKLLKDKGELKHYLFAIKSMNNFVFENSSKVYFGEGCVKEYLLNILTSYGDNLKTIKLKNNWLLKV